MTLAELIVQAEEAKAAHDAAKAATNATDEAVIALDEAGDLLQVAQAEEVSAYQTAATQLQEANDALLEFVKTSSVAVVD